MAATKDSLEFCWVVSTVLLIFSGYCYGISPNPNICEFPSCTDDPLQDVNSFCKQHNYTQMKRCCIMMQNKTEFIVGVDLRNCNISSANILQQNWTSDHGVYDKKKLLIIQLEENPMKTGNINDGGFVEIVNLEYLSLPGWQPCPGDEKAWKQTERTQNLTQCWQSLDLCLFRDEACPVNSNCTMHTPGQEWCECVDNFYGYKCLKQGTFPIVPYGVGTVVATVTLSAVGYLLMRKETHHHTA